MLPPALEAPRLPPGQALPTLGTLIAPVAPTLLSLPVPLPLATPAAPLASVASTLTSSPPRGLLDGGPSGPLPSREELQKRIDALEARVKQNEATCGRLQGEITKQDQAQKDLVKAIRGEQADLAKAIRDELKEWKDDMTEALAKDLKGLEQRLEQKLNNLVQERISSYDVQNKGGMVDLVKAHILAHDVQKKSELAEAIQQRNASGGAMVKKMSDYLNELNRRANAVEEAAIQSMEWHLGNLAAMVKGLSTDKEVLQRERVKLPQYFVPSPPFVRPEPSASI